jgi:5-methylcytosine-specific restriction endonuclease McrA
MEIDKQKVFEKLELNGLCAYCGQRITLENMQVDHMIPNVDSFDNLMPCCYECKSYKGNKHIEEFREELKNMHKQIIAYNQGIAMNYGIVKVWPYHGKFLFERY